MSETYICVNCNNIQPFSFNYECFACRHKVKPFGSFKGGQDE